MDESALLGHLKTLESNWGALDNWLRFWIVLIVVGVAMELIVVWIEYRHEKAAFNRGIIRPPDKPSVGLLVVGLLGAGLVAIGVAGELGIHIKAGKVESDMRNTTDLLVAVISQEAGAAKTSAVGAAQAAGQAKQAAAEVEAEARALRGEAGARRLSTEQKETLRKALEKLPTPIGVGFNPFDSEAKDLATDFVAALKSANWSAVSTLWVPNGRYGLFIGMTDKEGFNTPQVKLLREALEAVHTPATLLELKVGDTSFSPAAEAHVLYLLVAAHPPLSAGKNDKQRSSTAGSTR